MKSVAILGLLTILIVNIYLILVSLGIEIIRIGSNPVLDFFRNSEFAIAITVLFFAIIFSFVLLKIATGDRS
jgi:hypothetical protein